jgi:hypothetical protein
MLKKINNKDKFRYFDFTIDNYRKAIEYINFYSKIYTYDDALEIQKGVILRHDVDISLENAVSLAEIECKLKIKTTYCLLLHSQFYNLLDRTNIENVKKIIKYGHNIGLHFDVHALNIRDVDMLQEWLLKEKRILESYFDIAINIFSFHNNNTFTFSCREWKYSGMINAYSDVFWNGFNYLSDSNGIWKDESLLDFVKRNINQKMHILLHPVWWSKEVISPKERVEIVAKRKTDTCLSEYYRLLRFFNKNVIDG